MKIQEIDERKMNEVIETSPAGLFLCVEQNNTYIACDNSTGDAWVEEFETKEQAEDWLLRRL